MLRGALKAFTWREAGEEEVRGGGRGLRGRGARTFRGRVGERGAYLGWREGEGKA